MEQTSIKEKKPIGKKILLALGSLCAAVILAGCTQNFCSTTDFAHIMRAYEPGVTKFVDSSTDGALVYGNGYDQLYFVPEKNGTINKIDTAALASGLFIPTLDFWLSIDVTVFDLAFDGYTTKEGSAAVAKANVTTELAKTIMFEHGYPKFLGPKGSDQEQTIWSHFDQWVAQARFDDLVAGAGVTNAPTDSYIAAYKLEVNTYANANRSCIAVLQGNYGYFGPAGEAGTSVPITLKTWGDAFDVGFLEGLIVFPVAWLIEKLSVAFGGAGWGQIGAIVIVTIVVRLFLQALTFWATASQIRMQAAQPEIDALQRKYPNNKENQKEKEAMSMEQRQIYKKRKVHIWMPFLQMGVQFPIFISVWGAMQGAASLSTGALFDSLRLGSLMSSVLTVFDWSPAWWAAAVIFLIMAITQVGSMLLPTMLTKVRNKKLLNKLGPTPENPQKKTGNMMSIVMSLVIVVMGFMLPVAMTIYWIVGAIIAILTSVVVHFLTLRQMQKNDKNTGYKSKKVKFRK